jgi:hypothetical protein
MNRVQRAMTHGLAICFLLAAGAAYGQVPDKFTNLKHYPKDISKDDLMTEMRSFSRGLGVRCSHCHAGPPNAQLADMDFASDEKQAKKTARLMLKMMDVINGKHLSKLGKKKGDLVTVKCVTCHHGQSRPLLLEEVLATSLEEKGIEGMLARYKELRDDYYGGFTYDFGERVLLGFGSGMAEEGKLDAALAVMELNAQWYPDSFFNEYGMGGVRELRGEKGKALAHYRKSLELGEGRQKSFAQGKIDELSKE